ncbi:hypothetical protein [Sphingobacterium bovistauri]|uniref:Fimbrillin-like n=1 Tax=Sphingobacterium bovistauri TaxID=2781959 RepID=A0ABS7Z3T2_9SPHI|nr:hypothetical protein [Sphingobacterium bovistauri]MCA5004838.1 hypothetical protein [Sphingobacterium bovistauri]
MRSIVKILILFAVLYLSSCAKEMGDAPFLNEDVLMVNVSGIENYNVQKSASNNNEGLRSTPNQDSLNRANPEVIKISEGITMSTSIEQYPIGHENYSNSTSEKNIGKFSRKQLIAASYPMTAGTAYRIILFQNGVVHSTSSGTSGTSLGMPVSRGQTYEWAIYSYNTTFLPPSASVGVSDPKMQTPQKISNNIKELVYANGTVTIPTSGPVPPLNALLKQKLAKVYAEYNAEQHSLMILGLTGSFINQDGSSTPNSQGLLGATYFQYGDLNLRTGVIDNYTYFPTGNQNFHRPDFANYDIWRTYQYFTVNTAPISPIIIRMTALNMANSTSGPTIGVIPPDIVRQFDVTPVIGSTTVLKFTIREATYGIDCSQTAIEDVNTIVMAGVSIPAAHKIKVRVTGAVVGHYYNISTNTVDGVSYKAEGNFTVAGDQWIQLVPTGQYIVGGVRNFTITCNNPARSTCSQEVVVAHVNTGSYIENGLPLDAYPSLASRWGGTTDAYNSTTWRPRLAKNAIISADVRYAGQLESRFWYLYFRNVHSTNSWTYSYTGTSNLTADPTPRTGTGTLTAGARLVLSLDPYGMPFGEGGGGGYYGSGNSWADGLTKPETTTASIILTYQGVKYNYTLVFSPGTGTPALANPLYNSYLKTELKLNSVAKP